MDIPVTVGGLLIFVLIAGAVLGVCGLFLWFLSVLASGFNR